ncbi:MAG: YebC/PmpR family DNA-binding transcriptional regulator [Phycisphaerales bacterium]|nr:YebC/PmpR family DNA-binding transcriptional regulator [Phycisphaerales bacterium]
MAGHSKWANIKHRKARQDAVKSKAWSRCARAIIVAARNGGPDPTMNLTLRYAIDDARAVNMPKDNIEKAIKKGAGIGQDAVEYVSIRYEGYSPGGVAMIVDILTDNRNRTAAEIRHLFDKGGGNLGANGCVAFNFQARGVITIEKDKTNEDQITEIAIESGAHDVGLDDDLWTVTTEPTELLNIRQVIDEAGVEIESAEVRMIPTVTVKCAADDARRTLRLMEMLEEQDDVQQVWANFEISDEVLAELEAGMG